MIFWKEKQNKTKNPQTEQLSTFIIIGICFRKFKLLGLAKIYQKCTYRIFLHRLTYGTII